MGAGDTGNGNTQQGQQGSGGFESTNPFVEVQFLDTSSGADSVLWNFGDGNTSTERNPKHKFYANGNYNVTLTVTNTAGEAVSQESIQITGIVDDSSSLGNEESEVIFGCMDPAATNYDPNATQENGSCQYQSDPPPNEESSDWPSFLTQRGINNLQRLEEEFGYFAATDFENLIEMGIITFEQANIMLELLGKDPLSQVIPPTTPNVVYGCTDPAATNYNPNATQDNGSCQYPPPPTTYSYGLSGQMNNRQYNSINNTTNLDIMLNTVDNTGLIYKIQDYVGVSNAIKINGAFRTITNFQYNSSDNSGRVTIQSNMGNSSANDGMNFIVYNFSMTIESDTQLDMNWSGDTSGNTGGNTGGDTGGGENPPPQEVLGCTDPNALNYNSLATKDDGSCTYETDNYIPPK